MATSDAKKRANKKWNDAHHAEKYDRILVLAPKGTKAVAAAHAEKAGESISQYMLRATQARMDAEKED